MREHGLIIILGLLLTLLIEAPLLVFPFVSKNYQGINIPHFGTDSHFYLSRAKEALEGRGMGNPWLREGKERQDIMFMYNERALTAPIRFLGLADRINVVTLYNIYNFIGIFILILLAYFFVWQLSGSKLLSAVAAVFAIGGYHIVYRQFLYNDFNIYGRPMFPYMSSLAFFAYLNLLVLWLRTKKFIYGLFSAVALGSLFYIYFFAWTFALALNGALFLLYFLKREWAPAKSLTLISAAGVLIGFYNLFQMWALFQSDIGAQIAYFHWSSRTHLPIFSKIGAAMLLLLAFFWYRKRNNERIILISALILAGWISLNQQIITGKAVEIGHYYWYFIVPLSILAGLYMLWELLDNFAWRKQLFASMLVVVFLHGALGQYRSFFITLPGKEYEQSYRPIIAELKKDAAPGVVLAADDYLAYLIAIYTDRDLFWAGAASQTIMPFSRFSDMLYVYAYLNKEARGDFAGYLRSLMSDATDDSFYKGLYGFIEGFSSGMDYYDYVYKAKTDKNVIGPHRERLIADLAREYSQLTGGGGMAGLLKKYGVKYIVWDKNRHPEWDLSFLKFKLLLEHNNIDLYEVIY
ncbi:MAG: hypothetical protein HYW15_01585 [Candidatus Giovannonibacteria bacterium]|nr:MAG: hypothetical protein HYW15_01585 [Candidatus Giovannonibacteria bacterium]